MPARGGVFRCAIARSKAFEQACLLKHSRVAVWKRRDADPVRGRRESIESTLHNSFDFPVQCVRIIERSSQTDVHAVNVV